MRIHRLTIDQAPRIRAGGLANTGAKRPWRPVTDNWVGSADDRLWQRREASALDWFDDDSWISRARSI